MPPSKKEVPPKKESEMPRSRVSSRNSSRASTTLKSKESSVLTDGSLSILAREIGADKLNGLILSMYLNIPNTTIVNATIEVSENGLIDSNETTRIELTQKLLLIWKGLRMGSKEKEKVKELERACKDMGKPDVADVINDKHANNLELTSDAFAN